MDPFEHLSREHEQIVTVLDTLEHLAASSRDGLPVDTADLADLVSYLMDYGGLLHHEKEETILTPALVQSGFDWSEEPLSSVRREHRQVRYLVRSLYYLARQGEAWSREDARTFTDLAREYASYSRRHMRRAAGMFDLARERIDQRIKTELSRRFEAFDAEVQQAPDHANATLRIERVVGKYRASSADSSRALFRSARLSG